MNTVTLPRRAALLPVATVLAALLCGCSPHRLSGSCGIVVDGTGSSDSKDGFNAQQEIKDHVSGFLSGAGCRTVEFASISGDSLATRCHQDPVDLDPTVSGNVDRKLMRNSERTLATRRADQLRACVRTDSTSAPGSDILGGLTSIVRNRPAGTKSFPILVVSDFLQRDPSINLYSADLSTPAARARLIAKLAKEGRIPELSGVQITAAGYGMLQGSDPAKYTGFDLFWRQLLKERAKASDPLTIL